MDDNRHCPNGHLIFHTLQGSGCIRLYCEYAVSLTRNGKPSTKKRLELVRRKIPGGNSNEKVNNGG